MGEIYSITSPERLLRYFIKLNLILSPLMVIEAHEEDGLQEWIERNRNDLIEAKDLEELMANGRKNTDFSLEDEMKLMEGENSNLLETSDSLIAIPYFGLQSSLNETTAEINSKKVFEYAKTRVDACKGGLALTGMTGYRTGVFPGTTESFCTSGYGGYRAVETAVDDIQPQRAVLFHSYGDGASKLNESTREKFQSFGATWARGFRSGNQWAFGFVRGGRVFVEVLVNTPVYSAQGVGSTLFLHFPLPGGAACEEWPDTEAWRVRRQFCYGSVAYNRLCSCKNPLVLKSEERIFPKTKRNKIPISIVTAKGRANKIYQLLESLSQVEGVSREAVVVYMDGFDETIANLATILLLRYQVVKTAGSSKTLHTNQMIQFALYQQMKVFSDSQFFILLEDDLILAPDFYQFMVKVTPIFEMDGSIWCVSGYNPFSTNGGNSSRLYRGLPFPRWGWMMPRHILQEVLPKWPSKGLSFDWDLFLSFDKVNKRRVCLMPEVLRSTHGSTSGNNVHQSLFREQYLNSRKLNRKMKADLEPLERLVKSNYEAEMRRKISESLPVKISSKMESLQLDKGKSYVIYLNRSSENVDFASAIVHKMFGVWDHFVLHYLDVTELHYESANFYVVLHPSPYSLNLLPDQYPFFEPSDEEVEKFQRQDAEGQ